ncbi:Metalloproteases (zincins), catalytic [Glarea lozoyensis ATCC 20868]|uniref:Metalloproteases (Zincins), catalytic n=1 Tax=Glarea lozoyensis (strain ATCC 20868 / MF5171) TaxID=1116229 RepID=S3DEH8_GLAL2|nr:Metalloproteases (zincins), catalytic [Glarea lozoyensis ATCC 20868]EPE36165.1 Metalloproteases (zincins), catalytic [Glarea lozoyensis ATCC 20868]
MRLLSLLVSIWLGLAAALSFSRTPTIQRRQIPGFSEDEMKEMPNVSPRTYIDVACTDEEKPTIEFAWDEAKLLADAATNIVSGYDYNLPYTQWFGDDWNVQGDPKAEERAEAITHAFNQLGKLFRGEPKDHTYFIFRCNDKRKDCTGQTQAATWQTERKDGQHELLYQNVIFCPDFFTDKTLGEQIAR